MLEQNSDNIQYGLLVQSVSDHAIFMLDPEGRVRSWNIGAERIKGYTANGIIGRHFSVFFSQDDRATGVPERCLAIAQARGRCESQGWRLRQDGTSFWAKAIIHAVHEGGRLVGFAKITRDCTEERRQAAALETMAGNLRLALSFLPHRTCMIDPEQRIVLFNPAFQDLFIAAEKGAYLPDVVRHRLERDGVNSPYATNLPLGEAEGSLQEIVLGTTTISVHMREVRGHGWVATFEDVTDRRRADARMLHAVRHDAMTGLANGAGLDAHVNAVLDTGGCAVLYLGLDRFKLVNDTFGHHAGDLVLKETARRILHALRPEDFVCRLGGDEFVVVPACPSTADHALRVAERLREDLHRPYAVDGREMDVGVSIGIALSREGEGNAANLIGAADLALYQAKREGRGRISVYTEDLGIEALKRRSIELQLRQALDAKELSLVYQPICSADDGEVKGFEALLRWRQADGTPVSPADFVPIAEELGIMSQIGGWVLDTACREATAWPASFTVAVNVSATQMHDRDFLSRVQGALGLSGLHPCRLELEITETAMIRDHAFTLSILRDLRDMGVMIAMDDFGTGYSSLNVLRTLPFTRIKIDRSFVEDMTRNANALAIVRGVMRIGRDLGLSVTAEGVETEEQRALLIAEACQDLQGYLIARPMPGHRIPSFLASICPTRLIPSA